MRLQKLRRGAALALALLAATAAPTASAEPDRTTALPWYMEGGLWAGGVDPACLVERGGREPQPVPAPCRVPVDTRWRWTLAGAGVTFGFASAAAMSGFKRDYLAGRVQIPDHGMCSRALAKDEPYITPSIDMHYSVHVREGVVEIITNKGEENAKDYAAHSNVLRPHTLAVIAAIERGELVLEKR